MAGRDKRQRRPALAHQGLDDVAPQPVLGRERDPAPGPQPAGAHRFAPLRQPRGVLHIALRQRADRGGAEAEQHRRGVGGVALEVAVQRAGRKRPGELVFPPGVVVKPDRPPAVPGDHPLGRLGLLPARERTRQRRLGQQRLVLLHPWHVGVAEYRQPVGRELQRAGNRFGHAGGGLMGQAVHQVDVDRANPSPAQRVGAGPGGFERLDAVDRLLHRGSKSCTPRLARVQPIPSPARR